MSAGIEPVKIDITDSTIIKYVSSIWYWKPVCLPLDLVC